MIEQIQLAGFGTMEVLRTQLGDQIGVATGRGRRWLIVYDRHDNDSALVSVELDPREVAEVVDLLASLDGHPPERENVVVVGSIQEGLDALAGTR